MSEYGTYDELILENSRIRRENAEMLMRHGSIIAGITHAGLGIVDYLTHEQLIETLKQQREEAKLKSAMLEDFTKGIEEEGRTFNAPSARELDHLWKEIVLARKPDYGDWEYPAQACRHILAEIKEILGVEAFTGCVAGVFDDRDRADQGMESQGRTSPGQEALGRSMQAVRGGAMSEPTLAEREAAFEAAIIAYGIENSCRWFGHKTDSQFTKDTKKWAKEAKQHGTKETP